MRDKSIFKTIVVAAFLLLSSSIIVQGQTYSGEAAAVKTTVTIPLTPVLTTSVADTGSLPAPGGDITLTSAGVTIPNILTVGDATVRTSGGPLAVPPTPNSSQSLASINSLNVGILNGITITAGAIASTTSCSCPARTCTGTSTIANLVITDPFGNVTNINGTAAPNTTITIFALGGLAIGTVVINEQITSPGSLTVNALHVNLTVAGVNTDVIVASAHSEITCVSPPTVNFYSGRATAIRNRDRTVLGTDITTIVSDTGFLPTSGGTINVSTAGVALPVLPLTSGTVTSNSYGGVGGAPVTALNSSASDSTVENLDLSVADILPILPDLLSVTATAVGSETRCTCSLAEPTCTGDSEFVNLVISVAGIPIVIDIDFPPNQAIVLPLGLGLIVINEQFVTPPSPSIHPENITVNALHLNLDVLGLAVSDTIIASSHSDIDCGISPSAGEVAVAGRVMDIYGRGLSRAVVTVMDGEGFVRSAMTNSFGYYGIKDIPAGRTYIVTVSNKQYSFSPRTISLDSDLAGLDFSPDKSDRKIQTGLKR